MEKRIVRRCFNVIVREDKGMKPILLKCGLALALTFAGFLFSHLRTKRIKPSPKGHPSGHGREINSGIRAASSSYNNLLEGDNFDAEETCIKQVVGRTSPIGISPRIKQTIERDEYINPEFNDYMKESDFGASSTVAGNSSKKDVETPRSKVESPAAYASLEKDDYEQEIRKLRNMIIMLQERERSLEVQLLEYCGLREQETVVMELQNRLKISNMEAKMFNLKVETLQSENKRLEAQVSGHAKVLGELEAAKTKVKFLKRKIKYEAEQNKEHIINLKQKVSKLQDLEVKTAASDQEIQMKLKRLDDLEAEVEQWRKSNLRLQKDNSDLARRLDSTQILANSVLEDPEADALREESDRLRRDNEGLMKEVEQLQADRCTDLEELVYLRWINACLRHELRNYQPPQGKTVARDLSKCLSPTSERKAKQLILEYANVDGRTSISDFDSDQWSSSQASYVTDPGEIDEFSPLDNSTDARVNTTHKSKVFGKLMKLMRGKDNSNHLSNRVTSLEKSRSREDSINNSPHFSLSISTGNDAGAEGLRNEYETLTDTSRTSIDFNRTLSLKEGSRRNSDVGSSKNFSSRKSGSGDLKLTTHPFSDSYSLEKNNLIKYAEALKDSTSSETPKRFVHRRASSYTF